MEGHERKVFVSKTNQPGASNKPKTAFSRRGFIRGVGIGGGALGAGVLEQDAAAAPPQAAGTAVPVSLKINGKTHNVTLEPRITLLDALRQHLDLTGAKRVCDRGTCGACTVIMNGKVVYSCTVLAIDAQGKDIQTIEGISSENKLHPVSAAFVNHDAQQCGYCTPGFVMAAKGFLDRNPSPTLEQVEHGLSGNLCRCGTYIGVRKAVLEAAREMKGGRRA
jgi:aerobic-type carbon monoxide dehydrogenase small subunit (CoxS/CutS family)